MAVFPNIPGIKIHITDLDGLWFHESWSLDNSVKDEDEGEDELLNTASFSHPPSDSDPEYDADSDSDSSSTPSYHPPSTPRSNLLPNSSRNPHLDDNEPDITSNYISLHDEREFRVKIEMDKNFEFTSESLCFYLFVNGKAEGNCVVVPADLEIDHEEDEPLPFWVVRLGARGGEERFGFFDSDGEGDGDGEEQGDTEVVVEVWRGGEVVERGSMNSRREGEGEGEEEGDAEFCGVQEVDEMPLGVAIFRRRPGGMFPISLTVLLMGRRLIVRCRYCSSEESESRV